MNISIYSYKKFLTENLNSILAFLFVGGSTFIIYWSVLELILHYIKFNFYIAVTIAYFIGVLFHFTVNRSFVFKANQQNIKIQSLKYSCVLVINYLINLICMFIIVKLLDLLPFIGIAVSTFITAGSNYFIFKYWTFANNNLKNLEN